MSTNLSTKTANSTNLERPNIEAPIERPSAGDTAIAASTQQPLEQPAAEQPQTPSTKGLAQAAKMMAEIEGELAMQAYQQAADQILDRLSAAAERNNAEIFKRMHSTLTQHYSGNPAIAAILERYQK